MFEPDFEGPEGRLHHLSILVSDVDAIVQDCKKKGIFRGASELVCSAGWASAWVSRKVICELRVIPWSKYQFVT